MRLSSIILVAALLFTGAAAVAGAQTLASDKPDYAPGERATLTGSGFTSGEAVVLRVTHADASPDSGADHEPWTVVADGTGGFVTNWHVCEDDCVGASLLATAQGQTSGLQSEVIFTDSGPTGPLSNTPRDELYSTDGTVYTTVRSGGTIYIGGAFTTVGRFVGRAVPLDATSGASVSGFPKVGNGAVFAVAPDGSGGWYIGGSFTIVGGLVRGRIAHIDANNSVTAWNPNANSTVFSLAVDGSTVYVGGAFTSIGGQARSRIAALDATSGLATAWNPSANSTVRALVVDGSTVYAGGQFTSIGGQARSAIAALDTTSGLATAWDPSGDGTVRALAVDGSTVYAGGAFTSIGGQARNFIAALDATSGLATAWDPNADNSVLALAVDGSTVYAGGQFTNIGGQGRNFIAALDPTSGLATTWDPIAGSFVNALVVDGSTIYAGGLFTSIGIERRNFIAAIDAMSGLATSWNPSADNAVNALAVNGNTVCAGGAFTSMGAAVRPNVAAIDAASGAVTTFNQASSWIGTVLALAVDGGVVYVGGNFIFMVGPDRYNSIAKLDATTGFPYYWAALGGVSGTVNALAVGGNTVYVGGSFTHVVGQPRSNLGAIDATGGLTTAWNPSASSSVSALALSGGTVYVGGAFVSVGGQPRNRIAALDTTSGLATAWNPNANISVNAIALNGSTVYVGGQFTSIGGQARNRIAALDATSGLATAWNPSSNSIVRALAVDGSTIYAGGEFHSIGGQARNFIAALDATSGLATAWNPNPNSDVLALALDGNYVYIGGAFTSIGGDLRTGLAAFGSACTPPTISSCPPDVSVPCGSSTAPAATGTATATGTGVSVGFTDAFLAACGGSGVITRTWTATGTCGTASCVQRITIVDTAAPVVTLTGPTVGTVYPVGNAVSFTGSFIDACGAAHMATWMFDTISQPGVVTEGASGAVTASHTFTAAGVYKVKLTVADACGNSATAQQIDGMDAMVVIYDPSAGFVTGNGTIDSPPGAYPASPTIAGKANFGFVSKYKKGATVPTGDTEFQFKAAGLSFTGTAYEWLVVSGSRAQYKGSGTVNGLGGYGFLLTAVDGVIAGGGGTDKFRIKITSPSGVVYDNQIGDPDDATPSTALRSGSIIINTGGKGGAPAAAGPGALDGRRENLAASIPLEFALAQNSPNPFERSTRFAFGLPERSRIRIAVYDLAGREVRALADGEWGPGWHSAVLDRAGPTHNLGAGVYFVRMSAQSLASSRSFNSLRKIIVLE